MLTNPLHTHKMPIFDAKRFVEADPSPQVLIMTGAKERDSTATGIEVALDTGSFDTWLDICPYDEREDKKIERYGSYHMPVSSSGEPLEVCDPHGHCVTLSHDKYCADTASAKKAGNGDPFDVQKVDHDGLVGLACTTGKYAKHLGCSAFAEAKETFVYDRKADGSGQVCFSNPCGNDDECQPLRRRGTRVKLDTSTPVPVANGMILDTGSSATSQLPAGETRQLYGATCLVGFPDIKHLELNYEQEYIEYIVDEEAVATRCPALKELKKKSDGIEPR